MRLLPDPSSIRTLRFWPGVLALCAVLGAPGAAWSQSISTYGTGFLDGDETDYVMLGATIGGGLGLHPIATLNVYRLGYQNGPTENVSLYGAAPGLGLQYGVDNGFVSARASYHVVSEDVETLTFFPTLFTGGESGVATTLQAMYWGGPVVEALADYQWQGEFLYTEGSAHVPVVDLNPGALLLGGEAIYQTSLRENSNSSAILLGPSVRWDSGNVLQGTLSGGVKLNESADNTWYASVGFSATP